MSIRSRLKTATKKFFERADVLTWERKIAHIIGLYDQGLIETKDGKVMTHAEWAESKPEPLRSLLKSLISTDDKNLSE